MVQEFPLDIKVAERMRDYDGPGEASEADLSESRAASVRVCSKGIEIVRKEVSNT